MARQQSASQQQLARINERLAGPHGWAAYRGVKARIVVKALGADSALDIGLECLLRLAFGRAIQDKEVSKLFDYNNNGPLSSTIQKARLAYAMRLIDGRMLDTLKQLHIVRNSLAHRTDAGFLDADVLKACSKLSKKSPPSTETDAWDIYLPAVRDCLVSLKRSLSKSVKERIRSLGRSDCAGEVMTLKKAEARLRDKEPATKTR